MKILFVMLHRGYVRSFESVLRELCTRGHTAHLGFNIVAKQMDDLVAERLASELPVTLDQTPKRRDRWHATALLLRYLIDYARYFDERYASDSLLRQRMGLRLPGPYKSLRHVPPLPGPIVKQLLRMLMSLERAIPTDPRLDRYVAQHAPDIVLVTPLVNAGSGQVDVLKSAAALGIPTGVCVASWDNLTNKGLLRFDADRVFVWNDIQKWEAQKLHLVPESKIKVTGAPRFDEWFGRTPTRSRAAFLQDVGLDPEQSFVLYCCSSPFVAPPEKEVPFVKDWLRALRSATDERVRRLGVIVRPHPHNVGIWASEDLSEFTNAVVYPPQGENPVNPHSKADYHESILYAEAVVGINTTAQVEAAILNRPVLTIEADAFRQTQRGTLHYHYLESASEGVLTTAHSLAEHVSQLAELPTLTETARARNERFTRTFTRPHGLDVPATPLLASEIEALGALPRHQARGPSKPFKAVARLALAVLGRLAGEVDGDEGDAAEGPSRSRGKRAAHVASAGEHVR